MQTSLTVAQIYEGFPLYFGVRLDHTIKMYLQECLLSKNAKNLRNLLCDFQELELTLNGFIHLLEGHYCFSNHCALEFRQFIKEPKNRNFNSLQQFFINSSKLFKKTWGLKDQMGYALNLNRVLAKVFGCENDKTTEVLLQISQKILALQF